MLDKYINNTRDGDINFDLGLWYENKNHYAAAISHYLRAANFSNDKLLQYKSYLRAIICYKTLGNRHHTVKRMLQMAISHMPDRKEAYYLLSVHHEQQGEWHDAYMYATIGYNLLEHDSLIPEYKGNWTLQFQKGISAWWVGEYEQARVLLYNLKDNEALDEIHKQAIFNNISSIGYPEVAYRYTEDKYKSLKFKFNDAEKIKENYSQVYQDLFVLAALNGKKEGYYLEIGSDDPYLNNNTALLEEVFNWKGISIDINQGKVREFSQKRKNEVYCYDATKVNYKQLLRDYPQIIDYLQIDCEPPEVTLDVLTKIPFDEYKFRVITYEHDDYRSKNMELKQRSRDILRAHGYKLLVSDIAFHENCNFEDWWVHPDLVDKSTQDMLENTSNTIKQGKSYMFE